MAGRCGPQRGGIGLCLSKMVKVTKKFALASIPVSAAAISAMLCAAERWRKRSANLEDVVVSRTDMSMCSDAGQALIEEDIKEVGVNRVVIGACAPSLHEQTFRGTVARAGLNPYFYHHVGLREQDSWVHHDDPDGATEKAVRLMAAGIAKARLLEPLEPIRLEARKHALVIGGGVAGLRAAWDIARRGIKVTLIEKSPFLGGRMAQLETAVPKWGSGARSAKRSY